jgi:hypothetical protein
MLRARLLAPALGALALAGVAFTATQADGVPEPATLSLLAIGVAGIGFVAWRRRALSARPARANSGTEVGVRLAHGGALAGSARQRGLGRRNRWTRWF